MELQLGRLTWRTKFEGLVSGARLKAWVEVRMVGSRTIPRLATRALAEAVSRWCLLRKGGTDPRGIRV